MNEHDRFHDLIRSSLDEHADRLPATQGRLLGVLERVERRRNRRRRSVAVGSVAVVGLGVVGMVAVSGGDIEPAASDGTTPTRESVAPATVDLGQEIWWACTGEIEREGQVVYYSTCEQLPSDARLVESNTGLVDLDPSSTSIGPPITTVVATNPIQDTDPPVSDAEQSYTIVTGDSITQIAQRFGIEGDMLAAYNQWPEGLFHAIFPGDVVLIPPGALLVLEPDQLRRPGPTFHTIQAGDNPANVAEMYGITVEQLVMANSADSMTEFLIGTALTIPASP